MRRFRSLIQAIIIVIVVLVSGEFYQLYAYGFADFYQTSFYAQNEQEWSAMLEDIQMRVDESEVEILYVDTEIKGNYQTDIHIYCNEEVQSYLKKEYDMVPGEHKSFFAGTTTITYDSFLHIEEEDVLKNCEEYYLIGDLEQVRAFKSKLVDMYGGNVPIDSGYNSRKSNYLEYSLIWGIVLFVVLLLTFYHVHAMKKEFFVRISLGESRSSIIWKEIIRDNICFLVAFLLAVLISKRYNGMCYKIEISLIFIGILILLNSLLYLTLYRYNMKFGISNATISSSMLKVNYAVKFILTILVAISFSSNLVFLSQYMEWCVQKPYYQERSDYSYVLLKENAMTQNEQAWIDKSFWNTYYQEFDIQCNIGFTEEERLCIYMNSNMQSYLLEKFSCVKTELKSDKPLVLLPKDYAPSDLQKDSLLDWYNYWEETELEEVSFVTYEEDVKVSTYVSGEGARYVENPIIIVGRKQEWENEGLSIADVNVCIARVDENKLIEFCEENNCDYQLENVYERYSFQMQNLRRGAILNTVLLLIQLAIEIMLIVTIVKLECEVNRMEIVLKKIAGYSKWERIRRLYLVTIVSMLLGILSILIVRFTVTLPNVGFIIAGLVAIAVVEMVVITKIFGRMEKDSIQKTLKGGSL